MFEILSGMDERREWGRKSERRTRNKIKRGQKSRTRLLSDPAVPFVPVECGRCLYPLLLAVAGTTPIDNCLFRKIAPRSFHFRTPLFSARARTRSECARSRNAAREIPTGCCLVIFARARPPRRDYRARASTTNSIANTTRRDRSSSLPLTPLTPMSLSSSDSS